MVRGKRADDERLRIAEIRKRADDEWDRSRLWGARAAFGVIGSQAVLVIVLFLLPRLYPVVPLVAFLAWLYVFVRYLWHLERSARWRRQAPTAAYRRLHPLVRFAADWPVPVALGGLFLLSLGTIALINLSGR
jgi:hypothetical protein